eukprot:TRINITY_DN432_c1_g1_i1.p1 TRINITY_DN432_c1_g1~~TRINITY_DN432_c1_g1_i1.p1  ORF type:complete len:114 (-),score=12.04 TRINITY_DN432_c1_g1_i1:114-455(-)
MTKSMIFFFFLSSLSDQNTERRGSRILNTEKKDITQIIRITDNNLLCKADQLIEKLSGGLSCFAPHSLSPLFIYFLEKKQNKTHNTKKRLNDNCYDTLKIKKKRRRKNGERKK